MIVLTRQELKWISSALRFNADSLESDEQATALNAHFAETFRHTAEKIDAAINNDFKSIKIH